MTAVREHLLGDFPAHQGKPLAQPTFGLFAAEIKAGMSERLGIGEYMVALQMRLDTLAQPAGLHRQAVARRGVQNLARERPLDPIHDAPGDGIRIPADARARRVFLDPAPDQARMPFVAQARVRGVEVIEIMQIVGPQQRAAAPLPIGRPGTHALQVQQAKPLRSEHRRRRARRRGQGMGLRTQGWRRTFIGPRPAQGKSGAAEDLHRPQVAQRMEVIGEATQCNAASLTSMVTRLTSRISSSGIGGGPPARMACRNAAAQAI